MLPTIVVAGAKVDLDERSPLRALGFAHEVHAGLMGSPIRFPGITLDAGANDIFPSGGAAPFARYYVIQVQILPVKDEPAVLAGIPVPLKNVVPGELDLLLRHAIKQCEDDYARNANAEGDGVNAFGMRLFPGEIVPLVEAVGLEGAVRQVEHHLGMPLKKERERAPRTANVHSLPQSVQNKNLLVEKTHNDGLDCAGT